MRIKTSILMNIVVSFAISVAVLCAVFVILQDIGVEVERVQAYGAIKNKIEGLNLLLARFPTQPEATRIHQIKSICKSLEALLGQLKSSNHPEQSLIRQIRSNSQDLRLSLQKLISVPPQQGVSLSQERRDVLVSQLWMKTQFISDDTQRLMEISQAQIHSAQKKAGLLILALIVALILINAALSFFSGRSILRTEAKLRENQRKFKTAFYGSSVMKSISTLEEGRLLEINDAFEKVYGFRRDEIIGRTALEVGIWAEPEERLKLVQELGNSGRVRNLERTIRTKNGGLREVLFSAERIELGGKPCILSSALDITERKQAEQALQHLNKTLEQQVAERTALADARSKQLQNLAVELLKAEEKERQRISLLLHDDLQQLLASAKMQLQATDRSPDGIIDNVENLLLEAIDKSRSLSHELSPPVLQHSSLVPAIQWLIQKMKNQFDLSVVLRADEIHLHDTSLKTFVFRAVQELLFNIVKHADTREASIDISCSDNVLIIEVRDQGKGFEPAILDGKEKSVSLGLGLMSLRERASFMGGHFTIESAPGKGCCFTLRLPIGTDVEAPQAAPAGIQEQKEKIQAPKLVGKIRVLFADDHKIMRKGLMHLVSNHEEIEVVGEAANGVEACELARQLKPDVVVMDISMPIMDGIKATQHVKAERPEIRVIGLSMHEDEHVAKTMCAAGADCLISKTASPAQLLSAIFGKPAD